LHSPKSTSSLCLRSTLRLAVEMTTCQLWSVLFGLAYINWTMAMPNEKGLSLSVSINAVGNEQGEGGEGLEMGRARLRPRECDPWSNVGECPDDYPCMCESGPNMESDTCTCTKKLRPGEECDPNNPDEKCPEGFQCMCSWGCTCGGEWVRVPPPTNATNEPECIKNGNTCSIINDKCCKGKCIKTSDDKSYIGECSLLDEEKREGEKLTPKQPSFLYHSRM